MSGEIRISVFARTDVGRSREHNEDTFLVADLSSGQATLMPDVREHRLGERGSLFVVADGMGGAAAGELASSMATDLIWQHLVTTWRTDVDLTAERFAYRMREAVERANAEIHQYALEHAEVRGMGTTLTLAGIFGPEIFVAQIGDSRAYLIRGKQTFQLTRDQSLTQRLVEAGELTEEEAEASDRRNIILQALGPDSLVRVDLSRQTLRRDDMLVLCSDGLHGLVKKDEIGDLARGTPDLAALCSGLIDLANSRGGPDNITVVAARVSGEGLEPPDSTDAVGYQAFELDADSPTEELPLPVLPPARRTGSPRTFLIGAVLVALAILILSLLL
ncbi:MAG TPA: protein phosphatase 2C domain-containing protein [Gemmatimonadales bacterium]